MTGNEIIQRVLGDTEAATMVQARRAERARRASEQAAAGYVGPDREGRSIHTGDSVAYSGKIWTVERSQLRWTVNGMLTVPLTSVGTMQTTLTWRSPR